MTTSVAVAPYVAATFADGAGSRNLYLFSSYDGNTLVDLAPNPVYSDATSVGDPSIAYVGGRWLAAYTGSSQGSNGATFRLATSPDLVTWTFLGEVDCSTACSAESTAAGPSSWNPSGRWCWAPDLFVDRDGTVYVTVSINARVIYWTKALTADLRSWAVPQALPVSGIFGYVIDSNVVRVGATYHLHFKDSRPNVQSAVHATASQATGPYTLDTSTATGGPLVGAGQQWAAWTLQSNGYEGPCVCPSADGKGYYLYIDDSAPNGHGLMRAFSADPALKASSWGPLSGLYAPSGVRPRHGAVLPVTAVQLPPAALRRMCVVDATLRT